MADFLLLPSALHGAEAPLMGLVCGGAGGAGSDGGGAAGGAAAAGVHKRAADDMLMCVQSMDQVDKTVRARATQNTRRHRHRL